MICALEVAGNLHNEQLNRTPSFAFFATITGFILQPCFTPNFSCFFSKLHHELCHWKLEPDPKDFPGK